MSKKLKIQQFEMSSATRQVIENLPQEGRIKISANCFSYLDIDDNFIYQVYPLLDYPGVMKPDYFCASNNYIGAHISITYPEENTQLDPIESDKSITFEVAGLYYADLADTRYFVLKVDAPALIKIRKKYGLGDKMQLKDYTIEPHITIAWMNLAVKNQ